MNSSTKSNMALINENLKLSPKTSLFFFFINKGVIWVFFCSMLLVYINNFFPKIIFSDLFFKLWKISENIIYSLIAASIFYFFLEVLPKVKSQIDFYSYTLSLQSRLKTHLFFLKKALDLIPKKTEVLTESISIKKKKVPRELGTINKYDVRSILKKINEIKRREIEIFNKLFEAHNGNVVEKVFYYRLNIIKTTDLPIEGKLLDVYTEISIQIESLNEIERLILGHVNIKNQSS